MLTCGMDSAPIQVLKIANNKTMDKSATVTSKRAVKAVTDRQRLHVPRDVANIARRVQKLPCGDHAILVSVDFNGRITWRLATLGESEHSR